MLEDTPSLEPAPAVPDPTIPQSAIVPQDVVRLSMIPDPLTPAEEFARTARYASNPTHYIQEVLGANTFNSRKPLLCLPPQITRDIYGYGESKEHFETHIANLFGKSQGLFFVSGIQAQLAAVKIHCDRAGRPLAAWHSSSHLEGAEEKSYSTLYSLRRILVGQHADRLPTVEEIQTVLDRPLASRPAVLVLELPNRILGCQTHSFSDLVRISNLCRGAGVALHMDGARIWEIEPYYASRYGKSFADVAALFHTVYVSFYKGLRGAAGAMLLSSDAHLLPVARIWQQRAGGRCVTLSYLLADCERGFNENIGTFARKWRGMTEIVEAGKVATAAYRAPDGRKIVRFVPDVATCCKIHTVLAGFEHDALVRARDAVEARTGIRVFERVRPRGEFYPRESTVLEPGEEGEGGGPDSHKRADETDGKEFVIEWMITQGNENVETRLFVGGYVALCEELVRGQEQGR